MNDTDNIEEIDPSPMLPEDTHKVFYLVVNYYGSTTPYVMVAEKLENVSPSADKLYKIRIPHKLP